MDIFYYFMEKGCIYRAVVLYWKKERGTLHEKGKHL